MLTPDERAAMRERHRSDMGHLLDGDSGVPVCPKCRTLWPCDAERLLDALDEALETVEDLVSQHCYAESDGSYDTSALSTNRAAFDLLVQAGRAEYVGKQVGRRAFIRFTEATDA